MKKLAFSLAVLGLSFGAANVSLAETGKPITATVWIDNDSKMDTIVEALDHNCELIVSKKVCAHEDTKLVIKCSKDFKFAACPADKDHLAYALGGNPTQLPCEGNHETKFCPFDSPTFVQILKGKKKGTIELKCEKKHR